MSVHAKPSTAFLALDCDVYRAPLGTPRPDLTDLSPGASYAGFDAFGGVEVGFAITAEGATTVKRVMNYRTAAYKVAEEPEVKSAAFRAVDLNKAVVDTISRGGRILKFPDGTYQVDPGEHEEFAFLAIAREGDTAQPYFSPRARLSNPPAAGAHNGTDLAGYEITLMFLDPLATILQTLPAGFEEADVVPVDADGKELTAP